MKLSKTQLTALRTIADNPHNVSTSELTPDMKRKHGWLYVRYTTTGSLVTRGLIKGVETDTVMWRDEHYDTDYMFCYWEITEAGRAVLNG